MFSEFDGAAHVVSEPVGAVDARDRLVLLEIQDEPAAAEPFDARLRTGEAPAEAPDALEVECFSASEHEARHVFRLAVLVGVDPGGPAATEPKVRFSRNPRPGGLLVVGKCTG